MATPPKLSVLRSSSFPDTLLTQLTPPQTLEADVAPGPSAYVFVIDVSGSMNAAAMLQTTDGDAVNHGWSLLDIAKHSTNTFIGSLEAGDYISVLTYSDAANVILPWTECNEPGRARATAAVNGMQPRGSTNLMAGISKGFNQFEKWHEERDNRALPASSYAMNLVLTTDGVPSPQHHPARGVSGYNEIAISVVSRRG